MADRSTARSLPATAASLPLPSPPLPISTLTHMWRLPATLLILQLCAADNPVLIERACRKRPSLSFCKDFFESLPINAVEQKPSTTAAPKVPMAKAMPDLVPPPSNLRGDSAEEVVGKGGAKGSLVVPPNPEDIHADLPLPPLITPEPAAVRVMSTPPPVIDSVHFAGQPSNDELFGSLLRLPKPAAGPALIPPPIIEGMVDISGKDKITKAAPATTSTTTTTTTSTTTTTTTSTTTTTTTAAPKTTKAGSVGTAVNTTGPGEEDESILVFVSEYCVVEREHFVRKCHGEVAEEEVPFCKSYPQSCSSASNVLPVVSYCQRYYKQYPPLCTGGTIPEESIQFCFAFEQFCLPDVSADRKDAAKPHHALRRCEDVLPEARKVCNPFPDAKDTFNVVRCTQFLEHCKKYVDWKTTS